MNNFLLSVLDLPRPRSQLRKEGLINDSPDTPESPGQPNSASNQLNVNIAPNSLSTPVKDSLDSKKLVKLLSSEKSVVSTPPTAISKNITTPESKSGHDRSTNLAWRNLVEESEKSILSTPLSLTTSFATPLAAPITPESKVSNLDSNSNPASESSAWKFLLAGSSSIKQTFRPIVDGTNNEESVDEPDVLSLYETEPKNVEYTVDFPPGPMGLELEPVIVSSERQIGCRVKDYYFREDHVGISRVLLRHSVRVGDIITRVQGESVISLPFTVIVEKLRDISSSNRSIMFKNLATAVEHNGSTLKESISGGNLFGIDNHDSELGKLSSRNSSLNQLAVDGERTAEEIRSIEADREQSDSPASYLRDQLVRGGMALSAALGGNPSAIQNPLSIVSKSTEKILSTVEKIPIYSHYEMERIVHEQKELLQELAHTSFLLGLAQDREKQFASQLDASKDREQQIKEQLQSLQTEIQNLRSTNSSLQLEIRILSQSKADAEAASLSYANTISQLQSSNENYQNLNSTLRLEIDKMMLDQDKIKADLEDSYQQAMTEIESLEKSRDSALAEVEVMKDVLESEKARQESDYNRFREHMASQKDLFTQQIIEKDEILRSLTNELSEERRKIVNMMSEQSESVNRYNALEAIYESKEREAKDLLEKLNSQSLAVVSLQETERNLQKEVSELENIVNNMQNDIIDTRNENKSLLDRKSDDMKRIQELSVQQHAFEHQLSVKEKELSNLQQKYDHDIASLKTSLELKNREFIESLRTAESTHDSLRLEIQSKLDSAISKLENSLKLESKLQTENSRLENELSLKTLELKHANLQLEDANNTIDVLNGNLAISQTQTISASESTGQLQSIINTKTQENFKLKLDIDKLTEENSRNREELRVALLSKQEADIQCTGSMLVLQEKLNAATTKNVKLTQDLNNAMGKLSSMKTVFQHTFPTLRRDLAMAKQTFKIELESSQSHFQITLVEFQRQLNRKISQIESACKANAYNTIENIKTESAKEVRELKLALQEARIVEERRKEEENRIVIELKSAKELSSTLPEALQRYESASRLIESLNERISTQDSYIASESIKYAEISNRVDILELQLKLSSDEKQSLQQTIDNLDNQNKILLGELEKASQSFKFENLYEESTQTLSSQRNIITSLQQDLDATRAELKLASDQINQLHNLSKLSEDDASKQTAQLQETMQRELSRYQADLKKLSTDKSNEIEELLGQLDDSKQQASMQASQLAKKGAKLHEQHLLIDNLTKTNAELTTEISRLNSQSTVHELKIVIDSQEQKIIDLEKDIKILQSNNKVQASNINGSEAVLLENINLLQDKLLIESNKCEAAQSEIANLKFELDKLNLLITDKENELLASSAMLDQERSHHLHLRNEFDLLSSLLLSKGEEITKLSVQVAELSRLNTLAVQEPQYEQLYREAKQTIVDQRQMIDYLKQQLSSLQTASQLQASAEDMALIQSSALNDQLLKYKDDLEKLTKQLESAAIEEQKLLTHSRELETRISDQQSELSTFKAKIENLENEKINLITANDKMNAEICQLNQAITDAKKIHNSYVNEMSNTIKNYEVTISDQGQTINNLNDQLSTSVEYARSMTQQVQRIQETLSSQPITISDNIQTQPRSDHILLSNSEIMSLQQQILSLIISLKASEQSKAEVDYRYVRLENEKNHMKEEYEKTLQHTASLRTQQQKQYEEIIDRQHDERIKIVSAYEIKIGELQTERDEYRLALDSKVLELSTCALQLQQLKAYSHDINEEKDQLNAKLKELQMKFDEKSRESEKRKHDIQLNEERILSLQALLNESTPVNESQVHANLLLEQKAAHLQSQLQQSQSEYTALAKKFDDLSKHTSAELTRLQHLVQDSYSQASNSLSLTTNHSNEQDKEALRSLIVSEVRLELVAEYSKQLADEQQRIFDLEQQYHSSNQDLIRQVTTLTNQLHSAQEQLAISSVSSQRYKETEAKLLRRISDLEENLTQAVTTSTLDHNNAILALQQEKLTISSQLTSLQLQYDLVQHELKEATLKYAEKNILYEQKIRESEEAIAQLKNEHEAALLDAAKIYDAELIKVMGEKSKASTVSEIDHLQSIILKLSSECTLSKKLIEQKDEQFREAMTSLSNDKEKLSLLVAQKERMNTDLLEKVRKTEAELERSRQEVVRISEQNNEVLTAMQMQSEALEAAVEREEEYQMTKQRLEEILRSVQDTSTEKIQEANRSVIVLTAELEMTRQLLQEKEEELDTLTISVSDLIANTTTPVKPRKSADSSLASPSQTMRSGSWNMGFGSPESNVSHRDPILAQQETIEAWYDQLVAYVLDMHETLTFTLMDVYKPSSSSTAIDRNLEQDLIKLSQQLHTFHQQVLEAPWVMGTPTASSSGSHIPRILAPPHKIVQGGNTLENLILLKKSVSSTELARSLKIEVLVLKAVVKLCRKVIRKYRSSTSKSTKRMFIDIPIKTPIKLPDTEPSRLLDEYVRHESAFHVDEHNADNRRAETHLIKARIVPSILRKPSKPSTSSPDSALELGDEDRMKLESDDTDEFVIRSPPEFSALQDPSDIQLNSGYVSSDSEAEMDGGEDIWNISGDSADLTRHYDEMMMARWMDQHSHKKNVNK